MSRPGNRTSWIAAGSSPAAAERRRDHLVQQRGGRADRGRAGPQHPGVAGLQQLRGDVDDHVGPGLEVGADHADRLAPLLDQRAGQLAHHPGPLRVRHLGEHPQLVGHAVQPGGVEPEPVEHRRRQVGAVDVGLVRGEHRVGPVEQPVGDREQRGVDRLGAGGGDAAGGGVRGVGALPDGVGDLRHAQTLRRRPGRRAPEPGRRTRSRRRCPPCSRSRCGPGSARRSSSSCPSTARATTRSGRSGGTSRAGRACASPGSCPASTCSTRRTAPSTPARDTRPAPARSATGTPRPRSAP